jgi:FtsZ-binding cell division protein ZapB
MSCDFGKTPGLFTMTNTTAIESPNMGVYGSRSPTIKSRGGQPGIDDPALGVADSKLEGDRVQSENHGQLNQNRPLCEEDTKATSGDPQHPTLDKQRDEGGGTPGNNHRLTDQTSSTKPIGTSFGDGSQGASDLATRINTGQKAKASKLGRDDKSQAQAVKDLERFRDKLQRENVNLQKDKSSLQKDNSRLKDENSRLQEKITSLLKDRSTLLREKTILQNVTSQQRRTISSLEHRIHDLERQNTNLKTKVDYLRQEIMNQTSEFEEELEAIRAQHYINIPTVSDEMIRNEWQSISWNIRQLVNEFLPTVLTTAEAKEVCHTDGYNHVSCADMMLPVPRLCSVWFCAWIWRELYREIFCTSSKSWAGKPGNKLYNLFTDLHGRAFLTTQ